jgi:hypothetical protein
MQERWQSALDGLKDASWASQIVGAWEPAWPMPFLGGLLVMLAELDALRALTGIRRAELRIGVPRAGAGIAPALAGVLDASATIDTWLLAPGNRILAAADELKWPPAPLRESYDPASFARLIAIHASTARAPRLEWKASALERARAIAQRIPRGVRRIAVHLKNVPGQPDSESNASMGAWAGLFWRLQGEAIFVLLGDDPVPADVEQSANVLRSRRLGAMLADDLVLIQELDAFMGMSSGLCQGAIFGGKPYVVIKNPQHHAKEMAAEIGKHDRFPFAPAGQTFLRRLETESMLLDSFRALVSSIERERQQSG